MRTCKVTFRKRIADSGSKQFAWPVIGKAFIDVQENEKLKIDIKLDAIPIGWDGRLTLFEDE
ncbi:MAG TPA: hypothetical protein VIH27_03350 [Nitrososphaerales archaeon]